MEPERRIPTCNLHNSPPDCLIPSHSRGSRNLLRSAVLNEFRRPSHQPQIRTSVSRARGHRPTTAPSSPSPSPSRTKAPERLRDAPGPSSIAYKVRIFAERFVTRVPGEFLRLCEASPCRPPVHRSLSTAVRRASWMAMNNGGDTANLD